MTTCTKASPCTTGVRTRGMCDHQYRRTIRMGINGYRNATTARNHVNALRNLGWTYEQIGEAAGVSAWVPHQLVTAGTRRILADHERAIRAIPLQPRASHRGVDSTGTRRRVQALSWLGWPVGEVAARAGTTAATLRTLILPSRQISYALAQRVAAVYEQMSATPGPSRISAGKARQLGFAPPAAWDDDSIDDPQAVPIIEVEPDSRHVDHVLVGQVVEGRRPFADLNEAERVAACRRAIATGTPKAHVARAFGISTSVLAALTST